MQRLGRGLKGKELPVQTRGPELLESTLDASKKPGGTRAVSALGKQNQQLLGLSGQPA